MHFSCIEQKKIKKRKFSIFSFLFKFIYDLRFMIYINTLLYSIFFSFFADNNGKSFIVSVSCGQSEDIVVEPGEGRDKRLKEKLHK